MVTSGKISCAHRLTILIKVLILQEFEANHIFLFITEMVILMGISGIRKLLIKICAKCLTGINDLFWFNTLEHDLSRY